ncbi:hypothetical protein ACSQ67_005850 [Phaseolus vulgaris]
MLVCDSQKFGTRLVKNWSIWCSASQNLVQLLCTILLIQIFASGESGAVLENWCRLLLLPQVALHTNCKCCCRRKPGASVDLVWSGAAGVQTLIQKSGAVQWSYTNIGATTQFSLV